MSKFWLDLIHIVALSIELIFRCFTNVFLKSSTLNELNDVSTDIVSTHSLTQSNQIGDIDDGFTVSQSNQSLLSNESENVLNTAAQLDVPNAIKFDTQCMESPKTSSLPNDQKLLSSAEGQGQIAIKPSLKWFPSKLFHAAKYYSRVASQFIFDDYRRPTIEQTKPKSIFSNGILWVILCV